MLAMIVAFCVLGYNREEDHEFVVGKHRVPILAPTDPEGEFDFDMADDHDGFSEDWQTLFTQVICTFIFVAVILMVKSHGTTPSRDGALQALTVALTLAGLIHVANHHAATFNPAVSTGLTLFQLMALDNEGGYLTHYFYAYFFGPLIGGLLAGIFSRYHIPLHGGAQDDGKQGGLPAQKDEEGDSLIKQNEA